MTKKKPQDIVDTQPSEEELVVQEAPSLEQIAVDEPAEQEPGPAPVQWISHLDVITEYIWIDQAGNAFKLDQERQGRFVLRPHYGG